MNPKDLRRRIKAEIAEDIRLANGEDEQEHTQRHWPDRIQRQADAFRRILKRHKPIDTEYLGTVCTTCRQPGAPAIPCPWPCPEILDLASIYDIYISTGSQRAEPSVNATVAFTQHPAALQP